ncbi:MAG: DUF3810 family protein [Candidatus Eisenbacteria bacterium]
MSRPRPRGWFLAATLLAAGLFLPRLARFAPDLVEREYADKLFPNLMELLIVPARRVEVGLAQSLLLVFALAVVASLLHAVGRARKKRSLGAFFAHLPAGWASPPSWFGPSTWSGGSTTRVRRRPRATASPRSRSKRPTLARVTVVSPPTPTTPIASRSRRRRTRARRFDPRFATPAFAHDLAQSLSDAHGLHNARMARVDLPRPKFPQPLGELLSRCGINGIYIPFTGEAAVCAPPEPEQPFVMAHEMAHQRGIAREDEANFTSWLACREAVTPPRAWR